MINVIGMGYIGLPTAIMLAMSGHEVVGTDYNPEVIKQLNNNVKVFDELEIEDLYKQVIHKKITFTTEYMAANVYIISVPTPYDASTKKVDPSYVISAVRSVAEVCSDNAMVVIESTISPGTIDKHVRPILTEYMDKYNKKIRVAHAPERIIPGNIVYELKNNARTIGADTAEDGELVRSIYASFCEGKITVTSIRVAEMTKVVENTYRDVNIAFANELCKICDKAGLDVNEVISIANQHPRVNILKPGPGVGGHCIAVDPWFLVGDYPEEAKLIHQARLTNDSMPDYVIAKIREIMEMNDITSISEVGLYGLTYKENVSDIRESPTLQLIRRLQQYLAVGIKSYDPYVTTDVISNQVHSFDEFIADIKLLVIMVNHDDLKQHYDVLRDKLILDTRNCVDESVKHYKL